MRSIESRIAALEAQGNNDLTLIPIMDGETEAEALQKAGHQPNDLGRVIFLTRLDEML